MLDLWVVRMLELRLTRMVKLTEGCSLVKRCLLAAADWLPPGTHLRDLWVVALRTELESRALMPILD